MQNEDLNLKCIWERKLLDEFDRLVGYRSFLSSFNYAFEFVDGWDIEEEDEHKDKVRYRIRSGVVSGRPDKSSRDILDFESQDIAALKQSCDALEELVYNLIGFMKKNKLTMAVLAEPDKREYEVGNHLDWDKSVYNDSGIECMDLNDTGAVDFCALGMHAMPDSFYLYFEVLLTKEQYEAIKKEGQDETV